MDNPGSYTYTSAGYTLNVTFPGQSYAVDSYTMQNYGVVAVSQNFGAVAIEVKVTANGDASSLVQQGVGIVARHHSFRDLVFTVNVNGDWALGDSDSYDSSGHSSAIHTGLGVTNTLLVIARGNLYIGYVNGHYIGQFFDHFGNMGVAGQIGLVNLESGMTATFTDLKVWQVNAPPALTIV
jgi:outer membrane protein assembly factor BamB